MWIVSKMALFCIPESPLQKRLNKKFRSFFWFIFSLSKLNLFLYQKTFSSNKDRKSNKNFILIVQRETLEFKTSIDSIPNL